MLVFISQKADALKHVSEELRANKDFMMDQVQKDPKALKYAGLVCTSMSVWMQTYFHVHGALLVHDYVISGPPVAIDPMCLMFTSWKPQE